VADARSAVSKKGRSPNTVDPLKSSFRGVWALAVETRVKHISIRAIAVTRVLLSMIALLVLLEPA
jgi:hypothetical protein